MFYHSKETLTQTVCFIFLYYAIGFYWLLSHGCDNIYRRSHLREEAFLLAHSLRETVHPGEVGMAVGMTQLVVQQVHGQTGSRVLRMGVGPD